MKCKNKACFCDGSCRNNDSEFSKVLSGEIPLIAPMGDTSFVWTDEEEAHLHNTLHDMFIRIKQRKAKQI